MSSFKFRNLQRVILPAAAAYGVGGVQGIIVAGGTELDGMPRYDVQFLNHLKRAANGHMECRIVSVGEADLVAAQPPAMITLEQAMADKSQAYIDGMTDMNKRYVAEREERAAARARKRKKPAKAKSKSKRKR